MKKQIHKIEYRKYSISTVPNTVNKQKTVLFSGRIAYRFGRDSDRNDYVVLSYHDNTYSYNRNNRTTTVLQPYKAVRPQTV